MIEEFTFGERKKHMNNMSFVKIHPHKQTLVSEKSCFKRLLPKNLQTSTHFHLKFKNIFLLA